MQRFRKLHWILCALLVVTCSSGVARPPASSSATELPLPQVTERERKGQAPVPDLHDLVDELELDLSNSPLSAQEQDVAHAISERVKATEWLGAVGPVAVSPFFGLTCLSGIAIIGEDRLPEDHYLRRASTPLRHPLVFLSLLLLTILTSIPKFSKVSKPFGQAVDQLEAYSAIIILLVIRFMSGIELGPTAESEPIFQAGIVEFSAETLLMLATVLNIVVVNTVRFFFEIMIWITPVPFIDAIFETFNKSLCAGLAAIYAFSPAVATGLNLLILVLCLLAFSWVKRREIYYRTILLDLIRHWWTPNALLPPDGTLTVFPQTDFEGIPALAKCAMTKDAEGWTLTAKRWFRPPLEVRWDNRRPELRCGVLLNKLFVGESELRFGKRYNRHVVELAATLGADLNGKATGQSTRGMATEFG